MFHNLCFHSGLSLVLLLAVLHKCTAEPMETGDISDIIFNTDDDVGTLCVQESPNITGVSSVGVADMEITWTDISSLSQNVSGYQVLYWRSASSTYFLSSVGVATSYIISNLTGFTNYYITVRAVCEEDGVGVAAVRQGFSTMSRPPSTAPNITEYDDCHGQMAPVCNQTLVRWTGIEDDQWNGIMQHYKVLVSDVTPDSSLQIEHEVGPSVMELLIQDLQFDHTYLVLVHAVSSGGDGPNSNIIVFTIERPPEEVVNMESEPYFSNWFYLMIPAAFFLAVLVIVSIICCKKSADRRVAYVRDIHKNREDGVMPPIRSTMFHSEMRTSIRSQNRPLPPHPEPSTPSVNSVHAHLINDNLSPMTPGVMNFEMAGRGNMMHSHTQPPSGGDVFWVQGPEANSHFPTLSQPISDFSTCSGVPSSTFAESNIPHSLPEAPAPVNPYLVPNESETGHHSASPPAHMHTLPNPRRPHTATPHVSGRGGHMHGSVVAQSSVDIHSNVPPPVPNHRSNSSLGNLHHHHHHHHGNTNNNAATHPEVTSPQISRPESGLYSEIPNDASPEVKHAPRTAPLPSTGNASSIVSSDQYSSYSDIPAACGSPVNKDQEIPDNSKSVLQDPYSYPNSQSLSDSMSSFSDDSHNGSPLHEPYKGPHPNGRLNSCSSNRGRISSVSSSNKQKLDISFQSSDVYTDPDPTPYLSPMSIVSTEASPP